MPLRILAIDPGNEQSAYALINAADCRPIDVAKIPNVELRRKLLTGDFADYIDVTAIEMVASYGMAVGAEVFETVYWIGRFAECAQTNSIRVFRRDIKLHHCQSAKAKDANITQALIDRFAYGQPNRGKGTKANPGFFYGFAADMWQAYALAVYVADTQKQAAA